MIDEKLIQAYTDYTEKVLTAYVAQGLMTLSAAHKHLRSLVDTLFGTQSHEGLVQFIVQNDKSMPSLEEAIKKAESYFDRGWRIQARGSRFYIFDDGFKVIKDVTGTQTINVAPEIELGLEDTHVFLNKNDANAMIEIAKRNGIDKGQLRAPTFALEMMKQYGASPKGINLAINYKNLGQILQKITSFDAIGGGYSFQDLYTQGYRLTTDFNFENSRRTILASGAQKIVIKPISINTNAYLGQPQDYVSLFYRYNMKKIEASSKIKVEIPTEIQEMGKTYGLFFSLKNGDVAYQDYGELVRVVMASKNSKLFNNICDAVLYNVLSLSDRFTLGDLQVDSIGNNVIVRYTGKEFTMTSQDAQALIANLDTYKSTNPITPQELVEFTLTHDSQMYEILGKICKSATPSFIKFLEGLDASTCVSDQGLADFVQQLAAKIAEVSRS